MCEPMLRRLPDLFRTFTFVSAVAPMLLLMETFANAQGMYTGYPDGPVMRGLTTAQPLPVTTPGFGGPTQPGRMVHPSASPYLFQSSTSGDVIHTGAVTTASFPQEGVVDVAPESVRNLGISQSPPFSPLGNYSSGCSTGACGSLGDLMPFQWIHAVGGQEYGVSQNWYSQFGIFAPMVILPDESGLTFLQANGTVSNGDVYGANVGVVTRYQDPNSYWFFGSGFWYDYETQPIQDVHQLGVSLEALSRSIEVRANGYYPLGTTSRFESTTPQLSGLNVRTGYDNLALAGADIEGGIRPLELPELWFFFGYYFYKDTGNHLTADPLEGLRGRIELRPNRNLTLGVTVSQDDVYDTQVFASATLAFRSLSDFWTPPGSCEADPQFTQLVTRKSRIMTVRQNHLATSATTGN